jgi:hypothetical protein
LVAVGLALETVGYVVRVGDFPRSIARPLSMELPFSVPRLFIAALFAAAAIIAASGASRIPGRRTWWSAVAVVAAAIAAIKAGSQVHKAMLHSIDGYAHPVRSVVVMGSIAGGGLLWLWWLSRHERRDRARVLGALALYATASVGLSTVASEVELALGRSSAWSAAATLVEESAELLSGVAFLFAVLVGVAPRLVLPPSWVLRRSVDEHTLDLPVPAPRSAGTAPGAP